MNVLKIAHSKMPTKYPKLQEKKEKNKRKRYFIEIPSKFIKWLEWKKGDKINFWPSLADNDKSTFTVINIKLAEKTNPGLSYIDWRQKCLNKFYKGTKKHFRAWKERSEQEQLEEDFKLGNIPRDIGVFRSPEDNQLKLYPKIELSEKFTKEMAIAGRLKRRLFLKEELKEISKQIKNLKRRN